MLTGIDSDVTTTMLLDIFQVIAESEHCDDMLEESLIRLKWVVPIDHCVVIFSSANPGAEVELQPNHQSLYAQSSTKVGFISLVDSKYKTFTWHKKNFDTQVLSSSINPSIYDKAVTKAIEKIAPVDNLTRCLVFNFELGCHSQAHIIFLGDEAMYQSAVINTIKFYMKFLSQSIQKSYLIEDLNHTVIKLNEAHNNLVESEKMAALGSLVAGVSHEVNTPIGICRTATSYAESIVLDAKAKAANNTLTKAGFDTFLTEISDSLQLTSTNLSRSAELIKSFKSIAVEQSADELRQFDLIEYINDVLVSFQPTLNQGNHTVCVENVSDPIQMYSYPSAIYQVLSNLVMNSIVHGFEEGNAGTIKITLNSSDGMMTLIYRDDGCGVSSDVESSIFQPFVTTKRAQGGCGLGMNIVYNLVTQKLGGYIVLKNNQGSGVEFVITLPIKVGSLY